MAGPVVLGLDAGGTTTRALALDLTGRVLGTGRGTSGNPTSAGPEAAVRGWEGAARAALTAADRTAADVEALVVALAGQAHLVAPLDLRALLGLPERAVVSTEGDVMAMYRSGADEDDGCVVVAGTGSVAAQVAGGVLARVVGGSGWLLGDAGSGFATGHRVARAAVAHLDGSGPPTALTPAVLSAHGLHDDGRRHQGRPAVARALVDALYAERPVALAGLAPLAFTTPDDEVAAAIARRTHDELAALLAVLRGPAGSAARALPLVLGGSVLEHAVLSGGPPRSPALAEALEGADLRLVRDGAVGAGVLALRAAGVDVGAAHLAAVRAGDPSTPTSPTSPRT